MTRITGLATGLDIDSIIKQTMQGYRTKIDAQQQKKDIVEIKQKLYREAIKDSRDFYNKYFDILKNDNLLLTKSYQAIKFTSLNENMVTVTGSAEAKAGNYTIKGTIATPSKAVLTEKVNKGDTITINDKVFTLEGDTEKARVINLNDQLKNEGINVSVRYSNFTETGGTGSEAGFIFESTILGTSGDLRIITKDSENIVVKQGMDAKILIKDDKGGVYNHTGNTNTLELDGVIFKFNRDVTEEVTIKGTVNVDSTKEKIVNFVNDYNTLIEKLNKLTSEKRNRNYSPLTSEQKKEMSEKEIELWESKVNQGQLSRDNDLIRISNSLKESMRTLVDGASGFNLEKIGISPVADYSGTKNGTFTIDESKLTSALENNMEDVMNMFIKAKPTTEGLTESQKYSQTGIMYRLKDILYNETVTSTSLLIKKAGFEGTTAVFNNALSKSMEEYEKKIQEMESVFSTKEQALYSKYANLETLMNKYNSQMSYLSQSLGTSTS